jgi:hypothetical protein
MSLWHRAPREVYRVYGEDEYLVGDPVPGAEDAPAEKVTLDESFSHSRRLLGLGLLAVVTVGALALVVLNASHRSEEPHASAAAREVTSSARSRLARRGSVVDRVVLGRRSVGDSASDLETTPRASSVTLAQLVPSARSRSSLAGHTARLGGTTVGLYSWCGCAHPPTLESSAPGPPAATPPRPSADNEFDFER